MDNAASSPSLIELVNQAIARELQVAIQYMFQHSLGTVVSGSSDPLAAKQAKFVGSHSAVWLPGATLKKVAIAEMRHAESLAERVSQLGAEPTTQPAPVTLGHEPAEMLRIDQAEEQSAIDLYRRIIAVAAEEGDAVTEALFRRILKDEQKHLKTFTGLLA